MTQVFRVFLKSKADLKAFWNDRETAYLPFFLEQQKVTWVSLEGQCRQRCLREMKWKNSLIVRCPAARSWRWNQSQPSVVPRVDVQKKEYICVGSVALLCVP